MMPDVMMKAKVVNCRGYVCGDYSVNIVVIVVTLDDLVVSVLATGPKVREFRPVRRRWILRSIKVRRTTSFRGEVKPSVSCRKILRQDENIYFV
jgi:hypothetical protein